MTKLIVLLFSVIGIFPRGFTCEIPYIDEIWNDFHNKQYEDCLTRLDLAQFALFYLEKDKEDLIHVFLLKALLFEKMNDIEQSTRWKEFAIETSKDKEVIFFKSPEEKLDELKVLNEKISNEMELLKKYIYWRNSNE